MPKRAACWWTALMAEPQHSGGSVSQSAAPAGRPAAWAVLLGCGSTSLAFNIAHALGGDGGGHLAVALAVLYGTAPVGAGMGLSHMAAGFEGGWFLRVMTFAVMLGAMALSVGATAAVVAPVAPGWLRWLFPMVLDAAALVALQVIIARHPVDSAVARTVPAGPQRGTGTPATAGDGHGRRCPATTATTSVQGTTSAADGPAAIGATGGATTGSSTAGGAPATSPAHRRLADPGAGRSEGQRASSSARDVAGARVYEFAGSSHDDNGEKQVGRRGQSRRIMRDFWDSEIAADRVPTGADLNRCAGKDPGYSLGKRYAAEWRREIDARPLTERTERQQSSVDGNDLAGGGRR